MHRALHAFGSLPLGFAEEVFSPTSAGGSLEAETAEAELAAIAEALPHLTAMMAAETHDGRVSGSVEKEDGRRFPMSSQLRRETHARACTSIAR